MKINKMILFVLVFLLSAPAFAVQKEKVKSIEKLLVLTKAKESTDELIKQILSVQSQSIPDFPKYEKKVQEFLKKHVGFAATKNEVVEIYDEIFTHKEILGLISFYQSPLGKKLISRQKDIITKSVEISQRKMNAVSQDFLKIFKE